MEGDRANHATHGSIHIAVMWLGCGVALGGVTTAAALGAFRTQRASGHESRESALRDPAAASHLPAGPWGDIERVDVVLEPPAHLLLPELCPMERTVWRFPGN